MHAIIFGLCLEDFPDREMRGKNELGQEFYSSDIFRNIWKLGFVSLSDVSWNTCAYVARYVVKKTTTEYGNSPEDLGLEPEFVLMSRRPGLGREYLDLHPDALDFDIIPISTPNGCRKIEIPRYYTRLISEEKRDKLLERRKQSADNHRFLISSNSTVDYLDYLQEEERRKKEEVRVLSRSRIEK